MDGARVVLHWLPLGAGGRSVRWNGRVFELLVSRREHRSAAALVHSALEVSIGTQRYVIEVAPVWAGPSADRGVVGTGPVGARLLGHSSMFRYEVRRWRNGVIPDLAEAVGTVVVGHDPDRARRVLDLVPRVPLLVWGRDEAGAGDMWNSNSVVAWLLARSGHPVADLAWPLGCRAPGWRAGLVVSGAVSPASLPGRGHDRG